MKDVLVNLLRMQPHNLIPEVNYLAAFVWLMVVGCALFSIKSQKAGYFLKAVWAIIVICVPLAGLFAYCLYCLTKVEWTMVPSFAGPQGKGAGGPQVALKTGNARGRASKTLPSQVKLPSAQVPPAEQPSTKPTPGE